MANSSSGDPMVQRQVRILQAFARDHPELTGTELAARAGLSVSTEHRPAGDMVAEVPLCSAYPSPRARRCASRAASTSAAKASGSSRRRSSSVPSSVS